MTTTPPSDERSGSAMTDEAYGDLRASAALWAGTSVLITGRLGQVLVQSVDHRDTHLLPGGAVDKGEDAAARICTPLLLGHLTAPAGQPCRLRYAAPLDGVGPAPTDRMHTRVLATPEQVAELSDWGPAGAEQLASVHRARRRLGLPEAARRPVTELTGAATW
ncbi:hypothetical protein [Streptomyces sp. NPDC008125]|uniref:hypothetical protein n=1 Tax=Streptomyces sp. NPDC008125 TaxID=3364811 RepID=UPI0036ED55F7